MNFRLKPRISLNFDSITLDTSIFISSQTKWEYLQRHVLGRDLHLSLLNFRAGALLSIELALFDFYVKLTGFNEVIEPGYFRAKG